MPFGKHDWSASPGGYICLDCPAFISDREVGATKFIPNLTSEEPVLNQKLTFILESRTNTQEWREEDVELLEELEYDESAT